MQNGRADIRTSMPGTESNIIFKEPTDLGNPRIIDISQMRAGDAAEAFIELLNLPEVDDTYTKLAFLVEEPVIRIDPIQPKLIGEYFTITGSTNLNVDDELLIEFKPDFLQTEKIQPNEKLPGFSAICKVTRGGIFNKWSFDIDGGRLVKGRYILEVTSLETDQKTKMVIEITEQLPDS
jgi:trimeric autotransporter adhesin